MLSRLSQPDLTGGESVSDQQSGVGGDVSLNVNFGEVPPTLLYLEMLQEVAHSPAVIVIGMTQNDQINTANPSTP